jgi:hypothetical protein
MPDVIGAHAKSAPARIRRKQIRQDLRRLYMNGR